MDCVGTCHNGRREGARPQQREHISKTRLSARERSWAQAMQNDGLSEADKVRNVRAKVLEHFSTLRTSGGRTVIHEESDETYFLDNDREWKISSMTMQVVNDQAVTETRMLGSLWGCCNGPIL